MGHQHLVPLPVRFHVRVLQGQLVIALVAAGFGLTLAPVGFVRTTVHVHVEFSRAVMHRGCLWIPPDSVFSAVVAD